MSDDTHNEAPPDAGQQPGASPPPGPESAPQPPEGAGYLAPAPRRPSYLLLVALAATALAADLGTKYWARHALERVMPGGDAIPAPREIASCLTLVLARNKGGAWGLLQSAPEAVRRPFFLLISVLAIAFIVSLYRRVHPQQHALKWGLPLVLGGALGNLFDRLVYKSVIDFIDYRATWVRYLNEIVAKISHSHAVTDHWPTFNVADIAICIGVGLMAIDMFTSRRISADKKAAPLGVGPPPPASEPAPPPPPGSGP
jgi:signal peptidase II